jgi:hypothetical protein
MNLPSRHLPDAAETKKKIAGGGADPNTPSVRVPSRAWSEASTASPRIKIARRERESDIVGILDLSWVYKELAPYCSHNRTAFN